MENQYTQVFVPLWIISIYDSTLSVLVTLAFINWLWYMIGSNVHVLINCSGKEKVSS